MSQIHVLYTPLRVQKQGAGVDTQAVLKRLRSLVGSELAAGWTFVTSLPVPGSSGSWLVTLEHDLDAVCEAVKERVALTADPEFKLWQDDPASSRATATFVAPRNPVPELDQEPESESETEPLLLPLPLEIPPVLVKSEAGQRKRAASLGILLGIVFAAALGVLVPKGNPIRAIFDPHTPAAALPAVILCLFLWGILLGLNRRKRLTAIDRLSGLKLLPALVDGLRSHGVTGLSDALKDERVPYSPLLRRVRIVLQQWIIRPSLKNAQLAVDPQILSDQIETQRAYSLLRIFTWATPALGLLGLANGASFAFLILLEGLLASFILVLFASGLQTREERLYARIGRSLVEDFLPELQRVAPEQEPPSSALPTAAIVETTPSVLEESDAASQKRMDGWEESHESYLAELQSLQKSVESSSLSVVQAFESGTAAIALQMAETVSAQRALLEKMLGDAVQGMQAYSADIKDSTQTVVDSLQQVSGGICTQIGSVTEALHEATAKHRELTQQVFLESSQALPAYAADAIRAGAALSDLGKVTEQVLQSQATLQTAMAALGDSKLAGLLTELDATMKDLKPVLSSLSQPFVLQAVPVKSNQP